jgi:predicted amidohydrolase
MSRAEESGMKIGFVQFCPRFGDKDDNLRRVGEMVRGTEADLLVLPVPSAIG